MGDFLGMGSSDKSQNSASTSTTTTNTTNTNIDRRQVMAEGAFGLTTDTKEFQMNLTNNTLDAGAVNASMATVGKAIDAITVGDATNQQGFSGLLSMADKLFTGAASIIGKTADATTANNKLITGQVAEINAAAADSKGTIDQKTMILIAGIGAVAIVATLGKGKN